MRPQYLCEDDDKYDYQSTSAYLSAPINIIIIIIIVNENSRIQTVILVACNLTKELTILIFCGVTFRHGIHPDRSGPLSLAIPS